MHCRAVQEHMSDYPQVWESVCFREWKSLFAGIFNVFMEMLRLRRGTLPSTSSRFLETYFGSQLENWSTSPCGSWRC